MQRREDARRNFVWEPLGSSVLMSRPPRCRSVIPDIPPLSEYLALLEQIHRSGHFSNFGPLARQLEAKVLEMFGVADEVCVSCCNATAGLTASLLATGRSGRVIVPAFTFAASLGAVRAAGMTPLILDVDEHSWAIAAASLERALAAVEVGVVMLVAPFGIARNWDAEIAVCRKFGAAVVIDNASGLGAPRALAPVQPDVFEVVSMHATKPFAIGEGGAVFAHKSRESALRAALNFGIDSHSRAGGPFWGVNGKMSEFHAAVGLAQSRRFPAALAHRRTYVDRYRQRLQTFRGVNCPTDPLAAPWQFFPMLMPDAASADRFVACAAQQGLEIRRYYRPSLSLWPDMACFAACPVAEDLAQRMCVLPVRGLDFDIEADEMADLVMTALRRALKD